MTKFLSDKIDTIMKWAENRKLRYREPFELSWNDLQFFSEIGIFVSDIFVCFWFFHIAYHKIVIVEIEILIVLFTCLFIHNLPVIHILPFVSYYSYLFLKKKKKTALREDSYLSTQLCYMYWIRYVAPTKRIWIAIPQIRMYFSNFATCTDLSVFFQFF